MGVGGLGFGLYLAVDLALSPTWCRPEPWQGLGVFNIANALPFSIAPAVAPLILAVTGGKYGIVYAVAGGCALLGAAAILPVRRVRWVSPVRCGAASPSRLLSGCGCRIRACS